MRDAGGREETRLMDRHTIRIEHLVELIHAAHASVGLRERSGGLSVASGRCASHTT